jgi:hypothetical protein
MDPVPYFSGRPEAAGQATSRAAAFAEKVRHGGLPVRGLREPVGTNWFCDDDRIAV